MKKEELSKILEDHKLWAETRASEEKKGCRADLRGADLQDAYLSCANLGDANLSHANLRDADLQDAYLGGADLRGADLQDAYLGGADLRGANLSHANLRDANLRDANLSDANLQDTNLSRADLRDANLGGANLDFSCIPLWCGSLRVNMDDRQIKQLLYHALSIVVNSRNVSDELRQQLLTDENLMVANEFHCVGECPVLKNKRLWKKMQKNERWKDERKNNGTDISSVRHTE